MDGINFSWSRSFAGFSKRGGDSTQSVLHKNRDNGGPCQNSAGNVPTEAGSNSLRTSAHPPQAPEAPYSSAPPSRSTDEFKDAREPINSWGADSYCRHLVTKSGVPVVSELFYSLTAGKVQLLMSIRLLSCELFVRTLANVAGYRYCC